jgi:hypothetical protein
MDRLLQSKYADLPLQPLKLIAPNTSIHRALELLQYHPHLGITSHTTTGIMGIISYFDLSRFVFVNNKILDKETIQ